ncbi:MAG: rod-binding protein [Desulfovibrio sp.]|nr:rod-binding protein [Desulfovibrio sp.]
MQSQLQTARSANAEQSGHDFQARLAGLNGANMTPEAKEKKLREACEGFESIFIQKMWQEMRKSVHQTSFLHGREEQFWQDMYDQELAKKMTSAGGIGLADMMYEQLSRNLTSASQATARRQSGERAFVPQAASMFANSSPSEAEKSDPLASHAEKESAAQEKAADTHSAHSFYQEAPSAKDAEDVVASHAVEEKKLSGDEKRQEVAESVDPQIENALASMRAQVENKRLAQTVPASSPQLAHVSYSEPRLRQQPVASGLDMAKAARREAGDQLGSRGIREPLHPQTEQARAASNQADFRRAQRRALRHPQQNSQPLPYAHPSSQAEATDAQERMVAHDLQNSQRTFEPMPAAQSPFAPMASTDAQRQQEERNGMNGRRVNGRQNNLTRVRPQADDSIRTLNLGPSMQADPGRALYAPMDSASFAAERAVENTHGQKDSLQGEGRSQSSIPPLTAAELHS